MFGKVRNFFAQSTKFIQKSSVFQQKMLKRFLWTRRIYLWQPMPNCFAPSPIFLTQSTKLPRNHLFPSFFPLKIFHRTVRLKFRKPCCECLANSGTFSLKVRKSFKNHRFPMKNAQNIPLDTPNAALTNPAELFCLKSKFFLLKIQNY